LDVSSHVVWDAACAIAGGSCAIQGENTGQVIFIPTLFHAHHRASLSDGSFLEIFSSRTSKGRARSGVNDPIRTLCHHPLSLLQEERIIKTAFRDWLSCLQGRRRGLTGVADKARIGKSWTGSDDMTLLAWKEDAGK